MGPVQRRCRIRAPYFTLVTFDGSLTGGGATLQVGLQGIKEAAVKPVVAYWHKRWSERDRQLMQVKPGDPGGQARCEAFALLHALTVWRKTLGSTQGKLAVLGDALGVLYDVLRLKARDPVLNAMAADMALILAPMSLDVRVAHVWTQRNSICDALSRLDCDDQNMPAILSDATGMKL